MLLLAVAGLGCATACGPGVVTLGARGRAVANSGPDASVATGGVGGVSGKGAGGFGDAGFGQVGAGMAGSGGAPLGAAGSKPGVGNDAGAVAPADAGMPDAGPDPSTGCGMQPPTSDTSITINGSTARYIVDPTTGYDRNRPYPLVMSFRSANVAIETFRRTLDLPAVVGADGIVVNVDCANAAAMWDLQLDALVFDALLAKLEGNYCIDRRRVFLVGHETGAIFANALACTHAGVLRGLGSISGVKPPGMCTGPLAVWISQGSADMTLMLGRDNRNFWIQQNQCDATMSAPAGPAPCIEFLGCKPGKPVRYCEYDGDQSVPSFAAAGIWSFLKGL